MCSCLDLCGQEGESLYHADGDKDALTDGQCVSCRRSVVWQHYRVSDLCEMSRHMRTWNAHCPFGRPAPIRTDTNHRLRMGEVFRSFRSFLNATGERPIRMGLIDTNRTDPMCAGPYFELGLTHYLCTRPQLKPRYK